VNWATIGMGAFHPPFWHPVHTVGRPTGWSSAMTHKHCSSWQPDVVDMHDLAGERGGSAMNYPVGKAKYSGTPSRIGM